VVSRARFDELVAEALDSLPDWVLGLYHGIPLTKRGAGYAGVLPDTITLYRRTIEGLARDEDHLRSLIAHTVEHEVAHFFGISDDRLRDMDAY
jgi:predicted Zn-dependent protease with MMP-like domain